MSGFIPIGGGGGGGPATDPTKVLKTGDTMTGTLTIQPSNIYANGLIVSSIGAISLDGAVDGGKLTFGYGEPVHTYINIDNTTGDLIATAQAGPNAGKSVNLTVGKWA